MKNNFFIKVTTFLLIIAFISASSISMGELKTDNKGVRYYYDELTDIKYYSFPPIEMLEGRSLSERSDCLQGWIRVDGYLKERIKEYYKCKSDIADKEKRLKEANEEKSDKIAEYNKARDILKKLLLAALGRLGLQTTVIIADATTDLQLALKKAKDTVSQNVDDIKSARKKAEMISEFERLARKAAQLRAAKLKQIQYVESLGKALEQAILKVEKEKKEKKSGTEAEEPTSKTPESEEPIPPSKQPTAETTERPVAGPRGPPSVGQKIAKGDIGEDDFIYGARGPVGKDNQLEVLQREAEGGKLVSDIKSFPEVAGSSIIEKSIWNMKEVVKKGNKIFFDLTKMKDLRGVLNNTGDYADKVTSYELRYLKDNWGVYFNKDNVIFLNNKAVVPPPWETLR